MLTHGSVCPYSCIACNECKSDLENWWTTSDNKLLNGTHKVLAAESDSRLHTEQSLRRQRHQENHGGETEQIVNNMAM